jgi:hypothetical protein
MLTIEVPASAQVLPIPLGNNRHRRIFYVVRPWYNAPGEISVKAVCSCVFDRPMFWQYNSLTEAGSAIWHDPARAVEDIRHHLQNAPLWDLQFGVGNWVECVICEPPQDVRHSAVHAVGQHTNPRWEPSPGSWSGMGPKIGMVTG